MFTLTGADAQAALALVRAGTPVGNQLAPPANVSAKRRRLQQKADTGASDGDSWSQPPDLPLQDEELQQQLQEQLEESRRTGQHTSGAMAGVKVARMVHPMMP